MILAKTLPFISRVGNIDSRTISSFYKKIIGKLSTDENAILIDWRKRSIPTHSEWLYPLTFDAGKGLKEA